MRPLADTKSNKIFENPVLDAVAYSSPTTTWVTYGAIMAWLIYMNFSMGYVINGYAFAGIFIAAFFAWTLFEYLMHRYFFHWATRVKFLKDVIHTMHGLHHEEPRDKRRLFQPPITAVIVSAVMFGVFYLIMRTYTYSFMPGFIMGYLAYVTLHYLMHTYTPPKILKGLWKHHHLHHYKHDDRAYGVSSTIWDHVFKTLPPSSE